MQSPRVNFEMQLFYVLVGLFIEIENRFFAKNKTSELFSINFPFTLCFNRRKNLVLSLAPSSSCISIALLLDPLFFSPSKRSHWSKKGQRKMYGANSLKLKQLPSQTKTCTSTGFSLHFQMEKRRILTTLAQF